MGQSQAKPIGQPGQPTTPEEEQEIMKEIERTKDHVDKALVDNINNLNQILTQFKENDTKAMIDKIKRDNVLLQNFKNLSPEEQEKYRYKLKLDDNLLNKLEDIHGNILNNLDYSFGDVKTKGKLGDDKNLQQYIQGFVDKDLDLRMKDYLQNPFIQGDPTVARSMADVTNSIKTIRGKYKYFEYKYVQMNLFLMVFINYVNNTMRQYIDETAAFYAARQKYHLVLIQNVIKTFQSQLGDEAKKMTDIDIENFTIPLSQLTNEITKSITDNRNLAEAQKSKNLADILSFVMSKEAEFANAIVDSVDKYKEQSAIRNRATPVSLNTLPRESRIRKLYDALRTGTSPGSLTKVDTIYILSPSGQREAISITDPRATRERIDEYETAKKLYLRSVNRLNTGVGPNTRRDWTGRFLPQFTGRAAQQFVRGGGGDDNTKQEIEELPVELEEELQEGGFVRDGSWFPKNFYDI
jgi:hypothetical protein